ncbi:MAG: hypothetical protein HYY14_04510 [Candidatus Omnitrophica bacterium]|nr:hypothetical protein [Candidatus Omnitrophota bacterium]
MLRKLKIVVIAVTLILPQGGLHTWAGDVTGEPMALVRDLPVQDLNQASGFIGLDAALFSDQEYSIVNNLASSPLGDQMFFYARNPKWSSPTPGIPVLNKTLRAFGQIPGMKRELSVVFVSDKTFYDDLPKKKRLMARLLKPIAIGPLKRVFIIPAQDLPRDLIPVIAFELLRTQGDLSHVNPSIRLALQHLKAVES